MSIETSLDTEKKVEKGLIDEVKDLLPEIDFSGIEGVTETREQMQSRLDSMEKTIESLTEVLGETVKLYEATKNETKILRDHHIANIAVSSKATVDVAETMMNMLTIDYARLAHPLVEQGIIDKMGLTKTLKEDIEETADLEGFVEKVAKKVASETDLDIDYEGLVQELDYGQLMEYFDPTEYWDSSDLASYFCSEDIAYNIDTEEVANCVDMDDLSNHVDMDELSNHVDMDVLSSLVDMDELSNNMVANYVDMDELSNHVDAGEVAKGIDLDELAEKVKELMETEK